MDIVRYDLDKIDMYEEKGELWPVYNGLEYLICQLKSVGWWDCLICTVSIKTNWGQHKMPYVNFTDSHIDGSLKTKVA